MKRRQEIEIAKGSRSVPSASHRITLSACHRVSRRLLFAILLTLILTRPASAKPTQSDVFKSIQDNVGQTDESSVRAVPWVCAGIGVIFVLALVSKRQTRKTTSKPLNSQSKLMKEIMGAIPLKPRELKQLKVVADEISDPDADAPLNPLVLMLCPSLVIKVLQDESTRADRRTLITTLKKMGIR